MAVFQCNFRSTYLLGHSQIHAIIPAQWEDDDLHLDRSYYPEGKKYRTLYLFHGYTGDDSDWIRGSGIERYADEYNMAVIMPNCRNSFYSDYGPGHEYFSYIVSEIVPFAEKMFPLLRGRENRFTAGLSMGGYGAFKIAMSRPDLFSAAASLSGAVDIEGIVSGESVAKVDFTTLFGDLSKIGESEHSLFHLLEKGKEAMGDMRFFQTCGTEDSLYSMNVKFKEYMEKTKLDYTYAEGSGGHDWNFWDERIREVMQWINQK